MTDRVNARPIRQRKSGVKRPIIGAVVALVSFGLFFWGIGYLVEAFTRESTDDAFLEGHVIAIAPKVSGLVSAVYVTHYQSVKKGDPLFDIDPRDYEVALEQKNTSLASAQANEELVKAGFELLRTRVDTAEASARQAQADAAAARATAERAEADFKRAQGLIQQSVISQQEFDAARAAAVSAQAALRSAEEKVVTETSRVKESRQQLEAGRSAFEQATAQVGSAQADIKAAQLNLSYTKVTAPADGLIARKNVEPGSYVQVGQQLLALVPNDLWVIANFKETQLAKIRVGQQAEIEIDSVPGRTFRGRVDSMQPGSGSRFSLLPPENAVGNFVKVVQRVPVKIRFMEPLNAGHTLGPGMSVRPAVITSGFILPAWARIVLALVLAICTAALLLWFLHKRPKTEEG
jgi:membrane fusion protein (multidrug efflux system)